MSSELRLDDVQNIGMMQYIVAPFSICLSHSRQALCVYVCFILQVTFKAFKVIIYSVMRILL